MRTIGKLLLSLTLISMCVAKREFKIDYTRNTFVKDGRDYRIISGTIHHYNVPTKLWLDRLTKLRAMGWHCCGGLERISQVQITSNVVAVFDLICASPPDARYEHNAILPQLGTTRTETGRLPF